MNKRDFIKIAGGGMLSSGVSNWFKRSTDDNKIGDNSFFEKGFYIWTRPNVKENSKEIQQRYRKYAEKGIRGIMFESDSEEHFSIAKEAGMQAHRWMWTMNRGERYLLDNHPDWYAVNRKGVSCAEHPPYVNYYRWLCPSKPEVKDYLLEQSREILEKEYVDGIHLDYVRFCDVILAVNLWDTYDIVQQKETPEYDFCYCSDCREQYARLYGKDPLTDLKYPGQQDSWRQFRYDSITEIVTAIAGKAKDHKKPTSAAVFPTPEIARRLVRQDWSNWPLDAVFPMIYHGFYQEPPHWIGKAAMDGLRVLRGDFPMYAGIFLPDFHNKEEIETGILSAKKAGVRGVSIFGNIDDTILNIIDKHREF